MKNEISVRQSKNYHRNASKYLDGHSSCIICGKPTKTTRPHLWAFYGNLETVVTYDRGVELQKGKEARSDMGCWPIGADCLRRHPELKPFLINLNPGKGK